MTSTRVGGVRGTREKCGWASPRFLAGPRNDRRKGVGIAFKEGEGDGRRATFARRCSKPLQK